MNQILRKKQPLVKPEEYGGQHKKYHHHALSEIITGVGTFCHQG